MKLNDISVKDKKLFNEFLGIAGHELSVYAFENIYIWKALFNIRWAAADDSLRIFFQDRAGMFMYLPPLSEKLTEDIIEKSFSVMNSFNKNKALSRIENIEKKDIAFYKGLGYEYREKGREYLCRRRDMAELKGDKFKSKRAGVNYFIKHYKFEYLPFSAKDSRECLKLYGEWAKNRRTKHADHIYRGMLDDSRLCLKTLLDEYSGLDFKGRIVRVDGRVKGFTLGFRLNKETFCVLYEITDLDTKGISQFIFQKFCAEMPDYKYINIMDDSGLLNLKKVKLSYHPAKLIPSYIIKENKQ